MKKLMLTLSMSCLALPAFAADNCAQIRGEIEAKIKAVGVQLYKLEVVDADANVGGKVVGTCEAGKKKIIYWRL